MNKIVVIMSLMLAILGASCDDSLSGSDLQFCQSSSILLSANESAVCCNAKFDAKDITNDYIHTKYATKSFDLNISHENGADFNGTVCVKIVDSNNSDLSPWTKEYLVDQNSFIKSFSIAQAKQRAKVKIKYQISADVSCDTIDDSSSIYAQDMFAIRPKNLIVSDLNSTYISQQNIALVIKAQNNDNSISTSYDSSTLELSANKKFSDFSDDNGSLEGSATIASNGFSAGLAEVNISFSDIGIVEFTLQDNNWTIVDIDDGTSSDDLIIKSDFNTTFVPKQFIVLYPTITQKDFNNSFTYFSNDMNMSAYIDEFNLSIKAVGEQNLTTKNYTGTANGKYYAKLVSYKFDVDLNVSNIMSTTAFELNNTDMNFTNGMALLGIGKIRFNDDRNSTQAKNPKRIYGSEHNVSLYVIDSDNIEANSSKPLDGNVTFLYGRVNRNEIFSDTNSIDNVTIYYEVYCDNNCDDFNLTISKSQINWYTNTLHNSTQAGQTIYTSVMNTKINTGDSYTTSSITSGTEDLNLSNIQDELPLKDRIDMNTSSWLRYNPYIQTNIMDFYVNFGSDKNASDTKEESNSSWLGSGEQGKTLDLLIDKSSHMRLE